MGATCSGLLCIAIYTMILYLMLVLCNLLYIQAIVTKYLPLISKKFGALDFLFSIVNAMSCPDCFNGHVHTGESRGIEVRLHGIDTYVVEPDNATETRRIIVVVSDAFGWKTNNLRLLADTYAKRTGCRIYLPDFMNGKSLSFVTNIKLSPS